MVAPPTPMPTHQSALRLFFTLLRAVFRIVAEQRTTRKLFGLMRAAVAKEAATRQHVEALERTLVTAKADLKTSKAEATTAMATALAADADLRDRVTVALGSPQ